MLPLKRVVPTNADVAFGIEGESREPPCGTAVVVRRSIAMPDVEVPALGYAEPSSEVGVKGTRPREHVLEVLRITIEEEVKTGR